jgi:hypothetical protein
MYSSHRVGLLFPCVYILFFYELISSEINYVNILRFTIYNKTESLTTSFCIYLFEFYKTTASANASIIWNHTILPLRIYCIYFTFYLKCLIFFTRIPHPSTW